MEYLKRKKEHIYAILAGIHANGYMQGQLQQNVTIDFLRLEQKELESLVDQIYKKGLKDGAAK